MNTLEQKRHVLKGIAREFAGYKGSLEEPFYRNLLQKYNANGPTPLSMAFVFYCLDLVDEIVHGSGTRTLEKGTHVLKLWDSAHRGFRGVLPEEGDIVLWGDVDPLSQKIVGGTMGIILEIEARNKVLVAEGFTNSKFDFIKEKGQGIYLHERYLSGSKNKKVLGYFRPWLPVD